MTPRRLALDPNAIVPPALVNARPRAAAGLRRKALALAMHMACLGLFVASVVWPVVGPAASGELAREFGPLQEAFAAFIAQLWPAR
jgi:hypothetical protein